MEKIKAVWDNVWKKTGNDDEFWRWVRRESYGVRSRKIFFYLKENLGNIAGLKVIEVGAGGGVYSLVLARNGASVTLLDCSQEAQKIARKHFDSEGLLASYMLKDAFNLDSNLQDQFDVAMSFGTVEHYRYPERFQIAKAHLDLARPGGVVIISVPNCMFLPHEILKFYLQVRGKWHLGYEGAFTAKELFRLGRGLGLKNIEIKGSAFSTDLFRYLCIIQRTNTFRRFFSNKLLPLPVTERAGFFDNLLGADIFLMGCKP